ncbi:GIN domain-containing protein [Portibacter lacus]|nr:DUF2807 domain-containing protein [Portibacter lacus]
MSNIIILSLISLGIVTSFSFIYSMKQEIKFVEFSEITGSENLTSKIIEVASFEGIMAHDQIQVVIQQGEAKVEISAEDNLLEFLKVENINGELKIFIDRENKPNVHSNFPMVVRISNPEFQSIRAFNQSEILIEGALKQDRISIEMSNQSNLRGRLEVDSIDLSLVQQSNAYVNGNCEVLNVELQDQSGIKAGSLNSKTINVQLSDQTDAKLNALNSISGSLRNNSTLNLENKPEDNSISKSRMANLNVGWD